MLKVTKNDEQEAVHEWWQLFDHFPTEGRTCWWHIQQRSNCSATTDCNQLAAASAASWELKIHGYRRVSWCSPGAASLRDQLWKFLGCLGPPIGCNKCSWRAQFYTVASDRVYKPTAVKLIVSVSCWLVLCVSYWLSYFSLLAPILKHQAYVRTNIIRVYVRLNCLLSPFMHD